MSRASAASAGQNTPPQPTLKNNPRHPIALEAAEVLQLVVPEAAPLGPLEPLVEIQGLLTWLLRSQSAATCFEYDMHDTCCLPGTTLKKGHFPHQLKHQKPPLRIPRWPITRTFTLPTEPARLWRAPAQLSRALQEQRDEALLKSLSAPQGLPIIPPVLHPPGPPVCVVTIAAP